jgi:hypothetical protein
MSSSYSCVEPPGQLEANPDISGPGVNGHCI